MRPIDRSGAERLPPQPSPSNTSPIQAPTPSPAATLEPSSAQVAHAPKSNRSTLYRGPNAPAVSSALRRAWRQVEDTLFDAPLDAVTALGREFIESHLERVDVTRSVQKFAPRLQEAVARLAPGLVPRWPALDHYADAVRLVHAFLYTHAPDKDLADQPDYAAMCRHASALSDIFTRLGRALSRGDDATATPLMRIMMQRWNAYRHHQQRWQRSLLPATWSFPEQRLELTEPQVHALLVEPFAKLIQWQNMPALLSQLMFHLALPPADFSLAMDMLRDMRERLVDINPKDKTYLAEVLDVDELKRREGLGVLTPESVYRALALITSLLPEGAVNQSTFRTAEAGDWPVTLLPRAIVATYEGVFATYNAARQRRIIAAIPTIAAQGVTWERNNFAKLLASKKGRLPVTDAWLEEIRGHVPGNLRQQHAAALAALLIGKPSWDSKACPETLLLAATPLEEAAKKLSKCLRLALAGEHFKAVTKAHGVGATAAEVEELQGLLQRIGSKESASPLLMANTVLDEALVMLLKRGRDVERKDLADRYLHDMLEDLSDFAGPHAERQRNVLRGNFAACVQESPLQDPVSRGVSKVQLTVEKIARALQRLALIDLQVHGEYYAERLSAA